MNNSTTPVTLFIPCLVDQIYPDIGLAMVKILRNFGYNPEYLPKQTCCGQPAFNAGYRDEARKVAGNFIKVFEQSELMVAPSGSCTAMVRNYYPELFAGTELQEKAIAVSKNLLEFSEFIAQENLIDKLSGSYSGRVSFHNSCHSYREIGINENPIKILNKLSGFEFIPAPGEPVCCGFGGLFSVKYADISASMANTRLNTFEDLQIDTLVVNDPGCIMHMRQEAIDRKIEMKILHLTEFLADSIINED